VTLAADRQRRLRERQSLGRIVLRIEVDGVDHIEMLIEGGWLKRSEEEDRAAVNAATARLLIWLARPAANDV